MIIKHVNSTKSNLQTSSKVLIQGREVTMQVYQSSITHLNRMFDLIKRRTMYNVNVAILGSDSSYSVYRLHISSKMLAKMTNDFSHNLAIMLSKSNKVSKLGSFSVSKLSSPILINDSDSGKAFPCSLIIS